MEERQSHRRTQRYSVAWDARCTVDGRHLEGRLSNVSMGGAFVELAAPPAVHGTELIELMVQTDFGPMQIEARGCWSTSGEGRSGVGVRFTEDPGERLRRWYRDRWHEQLAEMN